MLAAALQGSAWTMCVATQLTPANTAYHIVVARVLSGTLCAPAIQFRFMVCSDNPQLGAQELLNAHFEE
jgi:hypothetical protein